MNAPRIAPADLADACAALGEAHRRGAAVSIAGGATAQGYGYPAERVDLVIETRRLARIVEHAPADMVVEVEAGCTLAALHAALAPHRQRLALDPPSPGRATIGGALATNAFGPLRARYGTLRDLIVGITLVRADGVPARGGGRVVKNVAGFDLPKVAVGSLGSLGLIATATFRLHPVPAAAVALEIDGCSAAALRALVRALGAAQLEPAAVWAERAEGAYRAALLFEGFEAGVAEQVERAGLIVQDIAGRAPATADSVRVQARDEAVRTSGSLRLRAHVPPSELEALDRFALAPLGALREARCALYPSLGVAFCNAEPDDPDAACAILDTARTALAALGGHLVLLEAPAAIRTAVDVYGSLPPSFELMRALKNRFDPERRLNRGRFLGGL